MLTQLMIMLFMDAAALWLSSMAVAMGVFVAVFTLGLPFYLIVKLLRK